MPQALPCGTATSRMRAGAGPSRGVFDARPNGMFARRRMDAGLGIRSRHRADAAKADGPRFSKREGSPDGKPQGGR